MGTPPIGSDTRVSVRGWLAVAAAAGGSFASTLDLQLINFSLGPLGQALDVDASLIAWVNVLPMLVSSSLILTAGAMGDAFGLRRLFTLGVALTTLSLILASLAQDLPQLLAARVVYGLGSAMVVSLVAAVVSRALPPSRWGIGIGVMGAGAGLGYMSGPVLGGLLLSWLPWQSIFYVRIPVHIVVFIMAAAFISRERQTEGVRIDYPGVVLTMLTMVSAMVAINQGGRLGWGHPVPLTAAAVTPFMLAALIWVERRASSPVLDLRLFRAQGYRLGLLIHMLTYHVQSGIPILAALLMLGGAQWSLVQAGLIVGLYPLARVLLSPVTGWLADRLGTQVMVTSGLGVLTAGTALLALVAESASIWVLAAAFVLAGVGFTLFEPANQSAIVGAVPGERTGTASSAIAVARQMGITSGIAVSLAAFVLVAARSASIATDQAKMDLLPPGAVSSGVGVAFWVLAAFSLTALLVALLQGFRRQRRGATPVATGL